MKTKNIIFVANSVLDLFFLSRILKKNSKKKFKYFLVAENKLSNNIFLKRLIDQYDIFYIFIEEFELFTNQKIKSIVNIFKKIRIDRKKIIKFLPNIKSRIYFFNAFHNSLTFTTLPIRGKKIFIKTNNCLKIKNCKNFFDQVNQFDIAVNKKNILRSLVNIIIYKLLFLKDLKLSNYVIDKKIFPFKNDHLKVTGISIKDNFKQLKISPHFDFNKIDNPKQEILFLFTKLEDENSFGINFDNSYKNISKYLNSFKMPITIKIHPNFNKNIDNSFFETLNSKIKIINDYNNAELYMPNYKYIVSCIASNAFKHFLNTNYSNKHEFISLIDLIEFEDPAVKNKFEQILYIICNKNLSRVFRPNRQNS